MGRTSPLTMCILLAFSLWLHAETTTKEKQRVPASRVGAEIVGRKLPVDKLRWLNTKDEQPLPLADRVTLFRWWTDTCPYCTRSLPVLQKLTDEFDGLQAVAVYHPKPPREVENDTILEAAIDRSYRGPVAADDEWAVLSAFYLSVAGRAATSVSFLVDATGKVRFIHPGPDLRPSSIAAEKQIDADYQDLCLAIDALLVEKAAVAKKSEKKPAE